MPWVHWMNVTLAKMRSVFLHWPQVSWREHLLQEIINALSNVLINANIISHCSVYQSLISLSDVLLLNVSTLYSSRSGMKIALQGLIQAVTNALLHARIHKIEGINLFCSYVIVSPLITHITTFMYAKRPCYGSTFSSSL